MAMRLEEYFLEMARDETCDCAIISTYGVPEIKQYCSPGIWECALEEMGWTQINISNKRYDLVLHLVTAACGASKNLKEEDKPEEMIREDELRRNCWTGHPNFHIVSNLKGRTFSDKIEHCIQRVNGLIGMPTNSNLTKKYLLELGPNEEINFPSDIEVQKFEKEETFLKSVNEKIRIRIYKRGSNGLYQYVYLVRAPSKDQGNTIEMMRQISAEKYLEESNMKLEDSITVQKKVYSFLYNQW